MDKGFKVLSASVKSRDNNLDFIRFIAALAVIFSHSFSICLGPNSHTPLSGLTDDRLSEGGLAVGVFFFIGGLLIAKSCESHPHAGRFFQLRLLRIMPQLVFVVLVLALIAGPILTTLSLSDYFANEQTYRYLLNGVFVLQHDLPGVFEANPYGPVVNAPLWTLPVEFACYILCFLCFRWTRFTRRSFAIASLPVAGLAIVYFAFFDYYQLSVVRAILLFYLGVACYVYRDDIRITPLLGWLSLALFAILVAVGLDVLAMLLAFPYALLWLGYGLKPRMANFARRGEYSYGIYLWGWPIQQVLVMLLPASMAVPWINALLASILAIGGGLLNYRLIDLNVSRVLSRLKGRRDRELAKEVAEP
ncbi:acyltransferase family protein [Adlercreutzia faecimuris]|uniref:Acyltransferase n=1 Tax=Adlercreutzia faecimuris TaxID=2897341 RepID=A0ABS9WFY9_9ACTN|nr:acyltransferase [Adlercreutzia sp. JBNU-10]MCI2241776.1 acyltransferase [Adlercreutzia sp. JBNU-10]